MTKNIIIAVPIVVAALLFLDRCRQKKHPIDTTTWQRTNDSLQSKINVVNDTVVYYKDKADSFRTLWILSQSKRPEIKIRYEKIADSIRSLPPDERLRFFSRLLSEADSNK